jgi:hypothetical protein
MPDERLAEALGRLADQRASADFTSRVLAGLDTPAPRPRARLRLAGAVVGLLLAALASTAVWRAWHARVADAAARQELAELQAEHHRLQQEWNDLRRLARKNEPVLYLGGNDNMDLVLDLRRIPPQAITLEAEPAARKQRSPR